MKKRFGIIIAILLCVMLLLTFVACKSSGDSLKGVDNSVIQEAYQKIEAGIDAWLKQNASDKAVNLSTELEEALKTDSNYFLITTDRNALIPEVSVAYNKDAANYTVTFIWKNGKKTLTKEFTHAVVIAEYDGWAGSFKDGYYDTVKLKKQKITNDKLDVLDKILDSAFGMVNKTVTDSVSGQFGVEGKVGVEVKDYNYGLEVKGNMDLLALSEDTENNTEFSIVLKRDEKVDLGGIYYENAAEEKDTYLYLSYKKKDGTYEYKKLNYATLNKFFDMLGLQFRDGKEDVIKSAKKNSGLDLLFELIGLGRSTGDLVSQIAGGLIEAYTGATKTNEKIYVIDVNFGTLMATVQKYGGLLNGMVQEYVKDIDLLKNLDMTGIHGIVGHITITVLADAEGNLSDFELSVNIPKCTVYFNADESKGSYDIPAISFGIYAKDFILDADRVVADVIPDVVIEEAEYFSPTNVNFSGDIVVSTQESAEAAAQVDTYHYHLVTEANPFKPSQIKASFSIMHTPGDTYKPTDASTELFFKLTYDQSTRTIATGGTVYKLNDEGKKAYTFTVTGDEFKKDFNDWLGITSWSGIDWDEKGYYYVKDWNALLTSAKNLLDNELGRYLIEYYQNKKMPVSAGGLSDGSDQKADEQASSTDNIKKYVEGGISIFKKIKNSNVKLEEGFTFTITAEELNEILDDINKLIGKDLVGIINRNVPGVNIPDVITDPSDIQLYVATKEHKDEMYLTFTYSDDKYELTIDKNDIIFKLTKEDGKVYNFTIVYDEATESVTATYSKPNTAAAIVTLKNVEFVWGDKNDNNLEMFTEDQLKEENVGKIFDESGEGIGTTLAGEVMKFANADIIRFASEKLGELFVRMLIRNEVIGYTHASAN